MSTFKQRFARKMGITEQLGFWDAMTNSPTITGGVGQTNSYYIVSVSGNTEIDGISDWDVNDWIYFNGVAWKKIDNSEESDIINSMSGSETDKAPSVASVKAYVAANASVGPQGPQGLPGEKGDKGDTGEQGLQGIQGLQGEKGDKGDQGDTGPTGPQGIQGEQGLKGDQGEVGPAGPQGIQGERGLTGEKGDKGDQGDIGPIGPQGESGANNVVDSMLGSEIDKAPSVNASKAYIDGEISFVRDDLSSEVTTLQAEDATLLKVDGSRQMQGNLHLGDHVITNVNVIQFSEQSTDEFGNTVSNGLGSISKSPGAELGINSMADIALFPAEKVNVYGQLDMKTNKISNLVDPTSAQDATTKTYVDAAVLNEEMARTGAISEEAMARVSADNSLTATLATKLNLSGGKMTGDLVFNSKKGMKTSDGLVAGALINYQVLLSGTNATYIPTPGTRLILVEMCGGGGGSGAVVGALGGGVTVSAPGGAAMSVRALIDVSEAATGTYTIGAGGSAGAYSGGIAASGSSGGNTSFYIGTAQLVAAGGAGGAADTNSSAGVGTSSGGTVSSGSSVNGTYLQVPGGDVRAWDIFNGYSVTTSCYTTGTYSIIFGRNFSRPALVSKYFQFNYSSNETYTMGVNGLAGSSPTQAQSPGTGATSAVNGSSATGRSGGSGSAGAIIIWEYA